MRNLKKILALVLALMMVVSVMVFASAADFSDYDDADEIDSDYAEAVEVLTGMGVFRGFDGGFQPDTKVTRAEVATLVYRILTGDVTDKNVDLYDDYDYFTDVAEANWFAGYVNYAANGKYVVGVGENRYDPQGNVTGYQLLVIMLRALGYGQNSEFEGTSQWTIRAATLAEELGITDGLKTSLNQELTREEVAYILFNAISLADQVEYIPALGYQPDFPRETIGEDVFDLTWFDGKQDTWGRPSYGWTYNKGNEITSYYYTPDAYYTTAVAECDVYDDVKTTDFTTYTNGLVNDASITISALATKATIGAQGRETYVYTNVAGEKDNDIIVYIDTFLAIVNGVTEVKYDDNGHIAKQAELILTVYDDAVGATYVKQSKTDWEYSVGDVLLVNAVTVDNKLHAAIRDNGDKDNYVAIVDEADSFVGGQSYIQWNNDQHTIDGEVYDDSLHFHRNDARLNSGINYNWWMDQFGNLIGATRLERTNYAVLKELTWTDNQAEATLLYPDGTEDTVVVDTIDGDGSDAEDENFWAANFDNAVPEMAASSAGFFGGAARVSPAIADRYNDVYDGFALYLVYTDDDGHVNLQGFEDRNDTSSIDVTYIDYANEATIDVGGSEIIDDDNDVLAHVDAGTQIIVNEGNGEYSFYTGTDELADFAGASVEVFWSTDGTFADVVYIKSYVAQATTGTHLFTTEKTETVGHVVGDREWFRNYYVTTVVVDGVERQIVTTARVWNILKDNIGKLFHVTFDEMPIEFGSALDPNYDYGYVEDVRLINEATDGDGAGECNYLSAIKVSDVGNAAIVDSMTGNNHSYSLTSATEIIYSDKAYEYDDLAEAVRDGCGVWVVDAADSISRKAATIYVGTKLDTSVALDVDVDSDEGTIEEDEDDPTKITFNSEKDVTEATLTYTANNANSVIEYEGTKTALYTVDASATKGQTRKTVTVYNEAGTDHEDYTITLKWNEKSNDASLESVEVDGTDVTIPTGRTDPKEESAFSLGSKAAFTMTVTASDDLAEVEIGSGDTLENAVKNLSVRNSVHVTETTELNGGYIVIKVTAEDGTVLHYVYDTDDPATGAGD